MAGQTSRSRQVLFTVLIAFAVLTLVDPFQWFSPQQKTPQTGVTKQTVTAAQTAFAQDAKAPDVLIAQAFQTNQILIAGEWGLVKQEVDFLAALLPKLPAQGVHFFGVDVLLAQDQATIDRLINAPQFDSALARDLLFRRLPLWGFQEYVDLLKAAWSVNATRSATDPPFRVLGLNVLQDLSGLKTAEDAQKPEIIKVILNSGIPDQAMAQTVLSVLAAEPRPNETKMLLFVTRKSAFTRWEDAAYTKEMAVHGFANQKRLGRTLWEKLEGQVATLLFHTPWPDSKSPTRVAYPAKQVFDIVLEEGGSSLRSRLPLAVDLTRSTLGDLDLEGTDLASASKLSNLGSVYILLAPLRELQIVTPIPEFINKDNLDRALKLLPGTLAGQNSPEQLNSAILNMVQDYHKVLRTF